MQRYENANPNPEYLIKSIAEQGYNLETALADLIDNSITANAGKIEILTNIEQDPFLLFVADDGCGMSEATLLKNMQLPSQSPEYGREQRDLGRFGLGLKTASFSQTRCFTVLSRVKGKEKFSGLTWDVDYLKDSGKWKIIVNSEEEINNLVSKYNEANYNHLNSFENYTPNTIIIWIGLYKFEEYVDIDNKRDALKKELTETTYEYLSVVFHRFLGRKCNPLIIRINNTLVMPFNPFPGELRALDPQQRLFGGDVIRLQGFVLPNSSIKEAREINNPWTPRNKSLMDMEGMYVYRADRLIIFGGWNRIINKMSRLQLARLQVEIGNKVDAHFHLNVSKSQISIPYELKMAFFRTVISLKEEAQKEYYNFSLNKISPKNKPETNLFSKVYTSKGVILEINKEYPLLKALQSSLKRNQSAELNCILKMITIQINRIRQVDSPNTIGDDAKDSISLEDVLISIKKLMELGFTVQQIKSDVLPNMGFSNNIPEEINIILK